MDGDGIDDQSDILLSAREYVSQRPRYKSVYYGSGYPDDQYGVCTDVVAFGALGAGYEMCIRDRSCRSFEACLLMSWPLYIFSRSSPISSGTK